MLAKWSSPKPWEIWANSYDAKDQYQSRYTKTHATITRRMSIWSNVCECGVSETYVVIYGTERTNVCHPCGYGKVGVETTCLDPEGKLCMRVGKMGKWYVRLREVHVVDLFSTLLSPERRRNPCGVHPNFTHPIPRTSTKFPTSQACLTVSSASRASSFMQHTPSK